MFLDGLDELDQKIIQLLIENARMSYSDIGEKIEKLMQEVIDPLLGIEDSPIS